MCLKSNVWDSDSTYTVSELFILKEVKRIIPNVLVLITLRQPRRLV